MIFKPLQIEKYFKSPDKAVRVFVVYGGNEGLVAEYSRKLVQTVSADLYDPFNVVYLNGSEVNDDFGRLAAEFNSRSLMGGRRGIVIKDADNNLTKPLKALLESSDSDTLLVITAGSLNKKSSLVVWGNDSPEAAMLPCYEDRDEDVRSMAKAKLVESGLTANEPTMQLLCSRLSNDRKISLGEIEKLITYMGDKKNVTVEDVEAVISDQSASSMDDLCYAAAGGRKTAVDAAYRKLLNEGTEAVAIVRTLAGHFNRLLTVQAALESGETIDKAMFKLQPRVIFFRESSFKSQAALWKRDRILGVLELLYKCERDCKTTNFPVEDMVGYMLLQVVSAAAKFFKNSSSW